MHPRARDGDESTEGEESEKAKRLWGPETDDGGTCKLRLREAPTVVGRG